MLKRLREVFKHEEGFTLIELLVVIAVLGILAGIAVPRITGVQDKARISAGETALRTIHNAMQMYYAENGKYPEDWSTLTGSDYLNGNVIPEGWTRDTKKNSYSDDSFTFAIVPDGTNDYDGITKMTITQDGTIKNTTS